MPAKSNNIKNPSLSKKKNTNNKNKFIDKRVVEQEKNGILPGFPSIHQLDYDNKSDLLC